MEYYNNLNYGIIGNCNSAALINKDASIDWCCLPQFDSASVFAKILDKNKGGSFGIICDESYASEQHYLENSCILRTFFSNEKDSFEVLDFMPRYLKGNTNFHAPPEIIRYIRKCSGNPIFKVHYDPKLEYAKGETMTIKKEDVIVSVTNSEAYDSLLLYTNLDKDKILNQEEIILESSAFFSISYNEKITLPTLESINLEFQRTKVYWLDWCSKTPTFKHYNKVILRSAMTLKLLSYEKSGAILAAATTSLPETIGEVRNWDYRFCWIRDASMVIRVISKLGHRKIVNKFINFIVDLIPDKDEKLQIMYGINGEKQLTETFLDHLSGYENSSPVRIGNAAFSQTQNDIYGILMDAIHAQIEQFPSDVDRLEELWGIVKGIIYVVQNNWKEKDKGIWEFRTEERHFTFSKLLCWVALDRGILIAKKLGKTRFLDPWTLIRDEIKAEIHQKAWNNEIQAFTQSYHTDQLDSAVLLMEYYGFIEPKDPKYVKTVHAIEKELSHDGLLYRYKNQDDFGIPSSSFTICTFWFINSLYKIGEVDKSKKLFDELLTYSNHLGLFSEDLDFKTKRLLGNFPQAYSHLALIDAALNFNE